MGRKAGENIPEGISAATAMCVVRGKYACRNSNWRVPEYSFEVNGADRTISLIHKADPTKRIKLDIDMMDELLRRARYEWGMFGE